LESTSTSSKPKDIES